MRLDPRDSGKLLDAEPAVPDEIEDKRRKLEDLLYDFEDFIELDTFDEDRFTELQAAVKSLALHVLDIIKRLKLDGVPVGPPPKMVSVFPPLPPLPPTVLLQAGGARSSSRSPVLTHGSKSPAGRSRDAPPQPQPQGAAEHASRPQRVPSAVSTSSTEGRRRRALTPQGLLRRDTTISHASSHYSIETLPPYSSEDVPMVPQALPESAQRASVAESLPPLADTQRPPSAERTSLTSAAHRLAPRRGGTLDMVSGPSANHSANHAHAPPARPAKEPVTPDTAGPEPLEIPVFPISRTTAWVAGQAATPTSPRFSARPLTIRESVIPEGRAVTGNPSFPEPEPNRFSHQAPGSPVHGPGGGDGHASSLGSAPPIMTPLSLPSAAAELESGLMVSEDWKTVVSEAHSGSRALMSVSSREPDCAIGPKSSLYQMKGFCEGAQAFKQGGHLQGVNKVQGYVAVSSACLRQPWAVF